MDDASVGHVRDGGAVHAERHSGALRVREADELDAALRRAVRELRKEQGAVDHASASARLQVLCVVAELRHRCPASSVGLSLAGDVKLADLRRLVQRGKTDQLEDAHARAGGHVHGGSQA